MRSTKVYGRRADVALGMWVKLARAFATFSRKTEDHIRNFGLTQPQFGALECLGHKGPMTIGDLCRKQLVTGGNMTVVIDNLEREGLAERVRSTEDRRAILVQLTLRGQRLFKRIFPGHAQFVANAAAVLSEQEQEELGRLLKKLGLALSVQE